MNDEPQSRPAAPGVCVIICSYNRARLPDRALRSLARQTLPPGLAAMAFSKPMIVTGVGGLPELVSDPRCVVPPNDANALAERIAECLKAPERLARMRAEAAALAQTFSWDRIAEESVALYESVRA